MRSKQMKGLSLVLACTLVLGCAVPAKAAKKMQLSAKKLSMKEGETKKLSVKNGGSKVKWSVKRGKSCVTLKKKTKKSVTIKAKKAGNAVVMMKAGKKSLSCRVTVKKVKDMKDTKDTKTMAPATEAPTVTTAATATPLATAAPTQTPVVTPVVTPEPTPEATEEPTPEPTPEVTEEPLEEGEFRYEGLDRQWIADNIDPSKPVVAMSFDDGPGGEQGAKSDGGYKIQEALVEAGAHATFFYIGDNIKKGDYWRDEVKQAVDNGFEIANHTMGYAGIDKADEEKIKDTVSKMDEILAEISGYSTFLFRVPNVAYGTAEHEKMMLEAIGKPVIDVSNWSHDYDPKVTKEKLIANVKQAKDGDIINMHSSYAKTVEAVPEILAYFKEKGIQVVSVSELFAIRGQKLFNGVKYNKCENK